MSGQDENNAYDVLSQIDIDLLLNTGYEMQVGVENVVILAHTHCMTSTYYLIRALVESVGVPARNIALLPKPYSTIPRTVRRLKSLGITVMAPNPAIGSDYDKSMTPYVREVCSWGHTQVTKLSQRRKKPRVLLIDDGGILTRQWLKDAKRRSTFDVVSIQQTRSGVAVLGETPPIPVINVAQSAAKRKFESHLIADAILRKTDKLGRIKSASAIGIFGLGMIGRAIAEGLLKDGYEVRICDEKAKEYDDEFNYWDDLREESTRKNFVDSCDLIFGTTSANWMQSYLIPNRIDNEKVFVSCSSRDREYQYIIRQSGAERVDEDDRYSDILWHPHKSEKSFRVLNGGFPINFDRQQEWERPAEIALTRVLILAAVLQAICTNVARGAARYVQLDPNIQQHLIKEWMQFCGKKPEDFSLKPSRLDDIDWWIKKSAGDAPISREVIKLALFRARLEAADQGPDDIASLLAR